MAAQNRVILLRHGQTEWSRDGRHTGRTDIPLTEQGRDQARTAAAPLAAMHVVRVLCSPLQRARDTAALAGLRVDGFRDDLLEWDYGDDDGKTTAETRQQYPGWVIWDGPHGGESVDAVGERVDRVIKECAGVGGDTCLVAHGHVLRILAARWLGLPPVDGRLLLLSTASISVLGHEHEARVIEHWNDTSHLQGLTQGS